jgi:GT2 family glycosyltransferase
MNFKNIPREFRIFFAKIKNLTLKTNQSKLRSYVLNMPKKRFKTILRDFNVYLMNPNKNTLNLRELELNYCTIQSPPVVAPVSNISIVVPIFNDFDMVSKLVFQLIDSEPLVEIVLVDDCSDEQDMFKKLQKLATETPRIKLIKTPENLGFTGSVNYALLFATQDNDILLLNSDTSVPNLFASRMHVKLQEDPRAASITPLSNAAEIASAPLIGVDCSSISADIALQLDQVARSKKTFWNSDVWPVTPTGVGFCMLISRKVINEIGMFDEDKYPRGYGEENDWSLRARNRGFLNFICPSVYVWHSHGATFGSEKELLQLLHSQQLNKDYPEYSGLIRNFYLNDPLEKYRLELYLIYLTEFSNSNLQIIFDSSVSGGARKYSREEGILKDSSIYLLIKPLNEEDLSMTIVHEKIQINFYGTWDDLVNFSQKFNDKSLLVNSIAFVPGTSSSKVIRKIRAYLVNSEITDCFIVLHDFHSLCPSINLINSHGRYCDLPQEETCQKCLPKNVFAIESKSVSIHEWRNEWSQLFMNLKEIRFPSNFAKEEFLRVFPAFDLKCFVISPTTKILRSYVSKVDPSLKKPLDFLVLGNINYAKGSGVLKSLSRELENLESDVYLRHFGLIDMDIQSKNYFNYGPYSSLNEIEECYEKFNFVGALFPSICPETYSYVCDELSGMNIPVIAFDIGAPFDRFQGQKNFHFVSIPKDGRKFLQEIEAVLIQSFKR